MPDPIAVGVGREGECGMTVVPRPRGGKSAPTPIVKAKRPGAHGGRLPVLPAPGVGPPPRDKCDPDAVRSRPRPTKPGRSRRRAAPGMAGLFGPGPGPATPAPDLSLVRLLHRGTDGFVSFHDKSGGEGGDAFRGLFSVLVADLEAEWPRASPHLGSDAYFSVNSYHRGGWGSSRVEPDLPPAYRATDGLRYLNACYADLDCHKLGLDPRAVVAEVSARVGAGSLPRVSIVVASGRGVWLFWLLRDPLHPDRPPRSISRLSRYQAVQRAVDAALADLGADAFDAARVTRVPGSVHSGANRRVRYDPHRDADGRVLDYTLEQMEQAFGLKAEPPRERGHRTPPPAGRASAKGRGWRAMRDSRLRQFEMLWTIRGGFTEGCRNRAEFLYASLLAMSGKPETAVREGVDRLAEQCRPVLTDGERRGAVREGTKNRKFGDQTISDWLDVTPGESAALGGWPPATRFHGPPAPADGNKLTRPAKREARRKLIRDLIGGGAVPTVRAMVDLLAGHGQAAGVRTVHADYVEMKIKSGRERVRSWPGPPQSDVREAGVRGRPTTPFPVRDTVAGQRLRRQRNLIRETPLAPVPGDSRSASTPSLLPFPVCPYSLGLIRLPRLTPLCPSLSVTSRAPKREPPPYMQGMEQGSHPRASSGATGA
jgi:hypothetical protein